MAKYRITAPDGGTYEVTAPDDATQEQVLAYAKANYKAPEKAAPSFGQMLKDEALTSLPGGLLRGLKDVVDTGAQVLSRVGGAEETARIKAENEAGKAEFSEAQKRAGAGGSNVARVGGNIIATLPVGGVLGSGAKALGMNRLASALTTGGFTTGGPVGAGIGARAADMGLRMLGGAATGGASAALVDPESAATGAVVGGLLPPVIMGAGLAGNAIGSAVRPFTKGGQERIAGDALRQFSTNPDALKNLRAAVPVIPGSMPTSTMSAGDEGLAGLSRTLQSVDPRYAAELSQRSAAQNAARTAALEEVAGNTGKLDIARAARGAATDPMREAVLDTAGRLPARSVLDSIDTMLAKPDNAGKIAQQALNEVRNRIAQFSPDGQIDARALYAIRKDINDTLSGKLQGESGNLKFASGQLVDVKKLIDKAIDQASRRVEVSASRAVMPAGANIERAGMAGAYGSTLPRPTWQGYLDEYTKRSIPINQMEKLDEVMRAISTGTVDQTGNAVLSAAKLNNLLRNRAKDLQQVLAPEQLELLRKISADLNAQQLASNAGRAVGSNTVQNLAQSNALSSVLGNKLASTGPAQSVLARILQLPYGTSNKMIQEKLGSALLNPEEAARLMAEPQANALMKLLSGGGGAAVYRAAPVISANP